ncbi:kelch repeat protein [Colletotrichum musicola]|uniref:Kelch repeat protein n=1 Tax=Colletotrichum musicola TaxID=2175873 RepID=A0A8H6N7D1_9PEZI|nr:kelch repeat protein [Colletotrichum musicola]
MFIGQDCLTLLIQVKQLHDIASYCVTPFVRCGIVTLGVLIGQVSCRSDRGLGIGTDEITQQLVSGEIFLPFHSITFIILGFSRSICNLETDIITRDSHIADEELLASVEKYDKPVNCLCILFVPLLPNVTNSMDGVPKTAFVIGQYLYVDGGWVNLTSRNDNKRKDWSNITFSIDLSGSWRPDDVQARQIRKPAPTTGRQAYFLDASSNNTVYGWGGLIEGDNPTSRTPLGKFVADGSGGGSWSTEFESQASHVGLDSLSRSHGGAVASTPEGGFYFGGMWEKTAKSSPGVWIPDYFQFNSTSPKTAWVNHTNSENGPFSPSSPSRTLYAASAHYIPDFGNGLIIIIGGSTYSPESGKSEDLGSETLWLLDPVTNKWYSQKTTGDKPRPQRRWPCTVGAPSRNGTYEIFMFGGKDDDDHFDDVSILSLPGFVWKGANSQAKAGTGRAFMSCVRAGNRQMIVVGGDSRRAIDTFPKGLGVFDMTDLIWKDSYDAGAAETTSRMHSICLLGNRGVADFKDHGLKDLFNSSRSQEPSDSKETQLPVGAIAGGVVGGVSLVALVLAVILILRRRRKRRAQVAPPADVYPTDTKRPHMGPAAVSYVSEMPAASNVSEMAEASNYSELPAELSNPGGVNGGNTRSHPAELDATTSHRTTP